jgi:hypothetical protein
MPADPLAQSSVLSPQSCLHYVILHHEGIPQPHFDLMFETAPGSLLAAWRMPVWPLTDPLAVRRLSVHRAAYLTYEGEIAGNRGRVHRIQKGECDVDIREAYWKVKLHPKPHGKEMTLTLTRNTADEWTLTESC